MTSPLGRVSRARAANTNAIRYHLRSHRAPARPTVEKNMVPGPRCWLSILALTGLAACTSGGGDGDSRTPPVTTSDLSAAAALGEKIFDDTSLSASGRLACASCHESDRAFAGDSVVPTGGSGLDVPGFRNA